MNFLDSLELSIILIRLRHFFFRYGILILLFLSFITLFFFWPQLDWQNKLALIGATLSFTYFIQKQKLEELNLFNELFKTFNDRYEALEKSLQEIKDEPTSSKISFEQKEILIKYFNLCGEEFLYYRLGYIYPEVWQAWLKGMQYYYTNKNINFFWDEELLQGSYYGLKSHTLCPRSRAKRKNKK